MKLLHIDSSALGSHSVSRELTARVVARLQQDQPGLQVTYRDLAAAPLDHWSPTAASGTDILDEFLAADVIVLGAPMYNFAIPTQLKAWIDRILVAGTTFRYTADGPQGLVRGKRVIVASVRGGAYSEGPAAVMDFQEPYLRAALGFIGIDQVEFVRAEGVASGPEQKERALAEAGQAIGALARAA